MSPWRASSRPEVVRRLRASGCVFAEEEADLLLAAVRTAEELDAAVERRACGVPIEHIVGRAELCGLEVAVDPGVFVPRRRSELLVEQAVAVTPPSGRVLDLCCGTGAIGLAVASARDLDLLCGVDVDPVAVDCARRNMAGTVGRALVGDLYDPLPLALQGTVDVIVANAPYVPTDAIPLLPAEARDHEPRHALDGGRDGLAVQRRVAAGAATWLAPGGHLLIETSRSQAPRTAELVATGGLVPRVVRDEERDATVVLGRRPPRPPGAGARRALRRALRRAPRAARA